tara:strand:- start:15 stop:746 length:732 start_codon:yes stop_codon:yes gene_type:complete
MTFRPLVDDHGEAVLMSFLEAFPARISAPPEREQELTERDPVCGNTWQELLVKYDLGSSSWKTHLFLWEEDLPESSVTLPRWGMMRGGECWEHTMSEHLTSGTESGLWRSPASRDYKGASDPEKRKAAGRQVGLNDQVRAWPTPSARDWKDSPGMSREGVNPDGSVRKRDDQLARRVFSEETSQAGGQLSPTWVEAYLMNWPVAWTSMEPLPKEVFHEWERGFLTGSIDSSASATDKCQSAQH